MALSFLRELKRRNVFRVAIGYVVLAWLMAQVAELLLETFGAPPWVLKSLLALLGIVLPFVIYFAWAFELTPEGVRREKAVEREKSITAQTGRKLDRTVIVMLLMALSWFALDRYYLSQPDLKKTADRTVESPQAATGEPLGPTLPVVAVLPFKATGSDDGGFLAAGLHDDLLTRLAKLGAYRVISRTSVMDYANTTKNMRQIGQELNAGYILEGGVQAMPGRVRINAQLIRTEADEHVWAEVYDHELSAENLFDVQAELALAIASALHTELSPSDQATANEVLTRNMAAYNAYLQGLQLSRSMGYVGTSRDRDAVAAFEEAVRLDPGFAEAWARLSAARIRAAINKQYDAESSEGVMTALGRARALKPGLLESELAWAEYQYRFLHEYAQALDTLEALGAIVTGNVDALQLMAFLTRRLGRYPEGYALLLEARKLAPRDPTIYIHLTHYAWLNEDCASARKYVEQLRTLAPDGVGSRVRQAEYEMECNGDTARAAAIYRELDFADLGWWLYPYWAAMHERDAEWAMALIEWDDPFASPFHELFDEVGTAQVHRYLLHDEDEVALALDRLERLLANMESEPELNQKSNFARAKAYFHALRGDARDAANWLDRANRRFEAETKGDISERDRNHLLSAEIYAQAGLNDEAVEELRIMLEKPGGYRFPLVDGLPVFAALESHPGYLGLRQRFGKSADE